MRAMFIEEKLKAIRDVAEAAAHSAGNYAFVYRQD